MGKTYKDRKGYEPPGMKRRGSGFRRGCNHKNAKSCEWCSDNLTISSKRVEGVDESEWDEVDESE